ncbi:MAG TPA: pitrilysin family protein [Gemmatimonadales bacterium]|nr:pitrilysin family protein [Gemmatimonadales bacterium]
MQARFMLVALLVAAGPTGPVPAPAQQPTDTRRAIESLRFPPLRFNPPLPKRVKLSNGVPVYLLVDKSLPLLQVTFVSKAGVAHLPDSMWSAGWQADNMIRTGGTNQLSPDSVDKLLEFYAVQFQVNTENELSQGFVSGLSRYRDQMLDLAFDLLRNPRNDTSRIRVLAAQQEENWRRRNDQPSSVLQRAWNQVMLDDHPLGRTLVRPEEIQGFAPQRFKWTEERIFCPENLLLGVSGDFDERPLLAKLESLFKGWARCKSGLRQLPPVKFADGPQTVLVEKDLNQTSIRMGHAGGLRVANTPEYFASTVANFLLGGGSGFSSRLLQRVRSDSGFAYSVFSFWEATPKREGQFAAGAQVRAEKTVAALRLIRQIVGSMATEPVTATDVRLARDNRVNSFVFQFENAGQIVSQQLSFAVNGLPPNWFDIYLQGIQKVTPEQVNGVSTRYLHPKRLVTVVVGKPSAFDGPLSEYGPVTMLPVDSIRR